MNPPDSAPASPTRPEAVTDAPAPPRSPDNARGVKAVLKKVRSQRQSSDPAFDRLLKEVRAKRPKASTKAIERAYWIAERAHAGQTRKSGDPFITHPLNVAMILAQFGLDETTISAALLHDAVEDTSLSLVDVEQELGYDVAQLIDGVTKLEKIKFRSAEQ
ncbi:MAG: HD domain-containing protein, partial [Actinomycetota bacterium]|nr:HD domain-containing protein [Actinomycetota bacterium]